MEVKGEQERAQKICDDLFNDMIGNNIQYDGQIINEQGNLIKKFIIYNDFTSSGKSLKSIETFIEHQILPTYSNIHSTVGNNAEITSKYLQEAKNILRNYTNAHGNYSIIFHGQGATGGVHKLIEILGIKKYEAFYDDLKTAYELKQVYGNEIVDKLKDGLIKKIVEQFNELFININFCFKVKDNNNYKTKCFLCEIDLLNEGEYHNHIKSEEHKKLLHENNPNNLQQENQIYDFIDIIRMKYNIRSNESILQLIDDYKRFKPVIFYSLYEHNSNSLSWKETNSEIVIIDADYDIFYTVLKLELVNHKDNYIKIGSFTACSNITGLLLDVDKIAHLMHNAYGYAFFDYAAGAPYLQIDLNNPLPDNYRKLLGFNQLEPDEKAKAFKDGIFFSPHKFIGGPNTPGVLITHDRIYRNQSKPTQPGGNANFNNAAYYIQDVELNKESGTPNIIGSIRLGLVISIRQKIPHDFIIKKNERYIKLFLKELVKIPNLYILHNDFLSNKVHIPIFSFMISFGEKFLHPNFICALLNDFFGIQSSPGCSCAPNYGRFLLGFDKNEAVNQLLQVAINEGNNIYKPGYLTLNLPYFYPEYVIKYVIKAIKFICENAHLLIGLYYYEIKSGRFYHYKIKNTGINYSLNFFDFSAKLPKQEDLYDIKNLKELDEDHLNKVFKDVENYVIKYTFLKEIFTAKNSQVQSLRNDFEPFGDYNNARWFLVFDDVKDMLMKMYNLWRKGQITVSFINDLSNLMVEFDKKIKERVKLWRIKYSKEIKDVIKYI